MQFIVISLINCWRLLRNLWRRSRHRHPYWIRWNIGGPLPEFAMPIPWWRRRFLGAAAPLSFYALRRRCERLNEQPQVIGVLLIFDDLPFGWAKLQSLREIIGDLRAKGIRVVAYLPNATSRAYAVACAADAIVMPPMGDLRLLGVRIEALFLADTLQMAGIAAEVTAVSPYKSGGDQFTRADLSPEAREQLERLASQRFAMLVNTVAEARNISVEEVQRLIDTAPHNATTAHEAGLLDAVLYEDELAAYLADQRTGTD